MAARRRSTLSPLKVPLQKAAGTSCASCVSLQSAPAGRGDQPAAGFAIGLNRRAAAALNEGLSNQGDAHVSHRRSGSHCTGGRRAFCRGEPRAWPRQARRHVRRGHGKRRARRLAGRIDGRRRYGGPSADARQGYGHAAREKAVAERRGGVLPRLHAWSVRRWLGQFLRLFLLRPLNIGHNKTALQRVPALSCDTVWLQHRSAGSTGRRLEDNNENTIDRGRINAGRGGTWWRRDASAARASQTTGLYDRHQRGRGPEQLCKRIRSARTEIGERPRWRVYRGRTRNAGCGKSTARASCDPPMGQHGGAASLAQFSRLSGYTQGRREIREI